MPRAHGKTLVEMLVVLVIVVIIGGIIFAVGSQAWRAVMSLAGK